MSRIAWCQSLQASSRAYQLIQEGCKRERCSKAYQVADECSPTSSQGERSVSNRLEESYVNERDRELEAL